MYVRCGDCRHATWLEPVRPGSSATWVCAGCGKSEDVLGSARLGAEPGDHFRNALELANRHHLDLPCAWSVLADVMTLDEAHACRVDMGLERPRRPQPPKRATRRDRAAETAMPATAADTDGDDDLEADDRTRAASKRIARRHGLPVSLAARVVRGELTLPAALLLKPTLVKPATEATHPAKDTAPAADPASARQSVRRLRAVAAVGALALLIAVSWIVRPRSGESDEAPPLRDMPANTEIRRDAAGHPVEIVGPDPESVLVAYCNQGDPSERCRPLKLVLGTTPRAGTRWGVFERRGAPDAHAIEIRRKGGARRWVAGDGEARIESVASPGSATESADTLASDL